MLRPTVEITPPRAFELSQIVKRFFFLAAAMLTLPQPVASQSYPAGRLPAPAYRALLEWAAHNAGTDLRPPAGLCVMIYDSLPGYTNPPEEVLSPPAIDGVPILPWSGCALDRETDSAPRHSVVVPGTERPGLRIRLGHIESIEPDGSYRVFLSIMQGLRWGAGYRCVMRETRSGPWEVTTCTGIANR